MNNQSKYSEAQIIAIIQQETTEENQVINHMFSQFSPMVNKLIINSGGDVNDCDRVIQDAMVQLILNIKARKFMGKSKLSTYFYTICRNLWFMELRRRKKKYKTSPTEPISFDRFEHQTVVPNELKGQVLNNVMGQLSEKCRKVLTLWSRGYSMLEIAEEMLYKNAQISMNKKNTCLRRLIELIDGNRMLKESLRSLL